MAIKKWFKKKAAILSLAMANVEKDMLGQNTFSLNNEVNHFVKNTKGTLMDSLINGEITQEVMDLRWRIYLATKAMAGYKLEIIGKDKDGEPIFRPKKHNKRQGLETIKVDNADEYLVEMVFTPKDITTGVQAMLGNKYVTEHTESILNVETIIDEKQSDDIEYVEPSIKESKSISQRMLGTISSDSLLASNKNEASIIITRKSFPKFKIEKYCKRLVIRKINLENKLLEFYVSKYPIDEEKNSYLFINEIKKSIVNAASKTTLELNKVEFITEDTLGADDMMRYEYEIIKFDKIVEYDGHYVIKFLAKVLVDGEDQFEKYRQTELDEKYAKKERRKNKFTK